MKKIIGALMAMALATSVFAMDITVGGKAELGGATTTINEETWYDIGSVFDYAFGATVGLNLTDSFAVSSEVIFRFNNGYSVKGTGMTGALTFKSIEFPVLVKYGFNIGAGKLNLVAGPSFDIFVGDVTVKQTDSMGTQTQTVPKKNMDLKSFNIAGVAGIEYAFPLGSGILTAGGKVKYDILSFYRHSDVEARRLSYVADIGYSIPLSF